MWAFPHCGIAIGGGYIFRFGGATRCPPGDGPPPTTSGGSPESRRHDPGSRQGLDRGVRDRSARQKSQNTDSVDKTWAVGISWDILASELEFMKTAESEDEGVNGDIRVVDLDVEKAASKLGRYRKTAVLLQALESAPSRDRVVAWVHDTIEVRLGFPVTQVTALNRREFMLVFLSEEDRGEVLARPPGFLDGKAMRLVEWSKRDSIKLTANLKVAWVELRNLPPFLEDQVAVMLAALGPGHWARACPKKRAAEDSQGIQAQTRGTTSGSGPIAGDNMVGSGIHIDPDGFQEVRSRATSKMGARGGQAADETHSSLNRFAVLNAVAEMEVVEDSEEASASKAEGLVAVVGDIGDNSVHDLNMDLAGRQIAVGEENAQPLETSVGHEVLRMNSWMEGVVDPTVIPLEITIAAPPLVVSNDSPKEVKLSLVQGTSFKKNLPKSVVSDKSQLDLSPIRRGPLFTGDLKKHARRGRAPKKRVAAVLEEGEMQIEANEAMGTVATEDLVSSADSASKVSRPVFGELLLNLLRPEEGKTGQEIPGEWGPKSINLMLDKRIKIISWNVRGLTRATKARAVRNWFQHKGRGAKVIAIQEVKTNSWVGNQWLKSVFKGGTVVFDRPIGSKGRTALLLHESLQVVEQGTGGNGRLTWARVQYGDRVIGFLSLYAPNKRRLRLRFWEQIKNITRKGEWCLVGDFNQVELPEDAVGRSAVISGREERWWYQYVSEKGLVDGYVCAAHRTGGRFTRMAQKEGRFVGSRLDRVYLTSGAGWIHHVKEVCHHNSSRLSDHLPISAVLQVQQEEEGHRNESYFKMDFYQLLRPEIREKAKVAWESEAETVKDSRRRWARGWQRVKKVLQDVRKENEFNRRADGNLVEEITWRRERLTSESPVEELQALIRTEEKLKAQELQDAREWRSRSREKWLAIDAAPARYFFTKLRAKWTRESIEALEDLDGEVLIEREDILQEIHRFYQHLYTAEEGNAVREQDRAEVVDLLERRMSELG
ncbi:hypothetical protein R1sor_017524 [Riccia sorocarpa]|uniref:Endonuclease/exonuclease/phosphatase domain-containing protein n=1 Tax=Riccia sorocarpa TaxID=122646 RepID=A0ABD3I9V6_9MARC